MTTNNFGDSIPRGHESEFIYAIVESEGGHPNKLRIDQYNHNGDPYYALRYDGKVIGRFSSRSAYTIEHLRKVIREGLNLPVKRPPRVPRSKRPGWTARRAPVTRFWV